MTAEWTFLDHTFRIGEETLPYVRQGLNEETAQKICEIIRDIAEVDAVAVTDRQTILGYAGLGCPFMVRHQPILTQATRNVLATGRLRLVTSKADFECPIAGCPCPLQAAVIAPLKVRDQVVGTLKLYRTDRNDIPGLIHRLGRGSPSCSACRWSWPRPSGCGSWRRGRGWRRCRPRSGPTSSSTP